MQTNVDPCGCHASKQSDSRDRGLISSLPIPYCTNSLLYVDFIHGLPRFAGYDSCLVVTCGLSRFTCVFLVHGDCPPASITQKRPNDGQVSVHGEPKFIEGQQPYVQ